MTRQLALFVLAMFISAPGPQAADPPVQGEQPVSFPFPDDPGGKLLAKTPSPQAPAAKFDAITAPKPRPAPASVESPLPALPGAVALVPRMPSSTHKGVSPHVVTGESLASRGENLPLPSEVTFFAADKTRLPSVD